LRHLLTHGQLADGSCQLKRLRSDCRGEHAFNIAKVVFSSLNTPVGDIRAAVFSEEIERPAQADHRLAVRTPNLLADIRHQTRIRSKLSLKTFATRGFHARPRCKNRWRPLQSRCHQLRDGQAAFRVDELLDDSRWSRLLCTRQPLKGYGDRCTQRRVLTNSSDVHRTSPLKVSEPEPAGPFHSRENRHAPDMPKSPVAR
jgi:hypothetical protein